MIIQCISLSRWNSSPIYSQQMPSSFESLSEWRLSVKHGRKCTVSHNSQFFHPILKIPFEPWHFRLKSQVERISGQLIPIKGKSAFLICCSWFPCQCEYCSSNLEKRIQVAQDSTVGAGLGAWLFICKYFITQLYNIIHMSDGEVSYLCMWLALLFLMEVSPWQLLD